MNAPIVPELHRLMIPERSGVDAVLAASDQLVADRERLEHELAVLREENDELRCRVEELEAEVMEAAGNYRRPQAQSIVNGVTR